MLRFRDDAWGPGVAWVSWRCAGISACLISAGLIAVEGFCLAQGFWANYDCFYKLGAPSLVSWQSEPYHLGLFLPGLGVQTFHDQEGRPEYRGNIHPKYYSYTVL